jgi:hypothetical protein
MSIERLTYADLAGRFGTRREAALRTVLMAEQYVTEQEARIAKAFGASP